MKKLLNLLLKKDKNYENNSSYESEHLNLDFFNGYGGFNKENNSCNKA